MIETTLIEHLPKYETIYLEIVDEIKISMYKDDLILRGFSQEEVLKLKAIVTKIFKAVAFKLRKFHSNYQLKSVDTSIKTSKESAKAIDRSRN